MSEPFTPEQMREIADQMPKNLELGELLRFLVGVVNCYDLPPDEGASLFLSAACHYAEKPTNKETLQ